MEVLDDPFAGLDQEIAWGDVFVAQAGELMSRDAEGSLTEDLLKKVDTLLSSAEEMLEYSDYLRLVSSIQAGCMHDHSLQNQLQNSEHKESLFGATDAHDTNKHVESDDDKKKKKKKAASLGRASVWFRREPQKKTPKSFFSVH